MVGTRRDDRHERDKRRCRGDGGGGDRRMRGALVVVGFLVAAAAVTGIGFAFGNGGPAGEAVESAPTTTTATDGGGTNDGGADAGATGDGGASDGGATTPAEPSFAFVVDDVEACGETCRDVTSTLTNDGTAASDVTVDTRIYAGNGTDGDAVWQGSEPVGSLGAGESYTTTKRVELSFGDALAVQGADGWITVETTVESDERTVTFTERRNVL
jgi:hypothetical protein